MVAVCRSHESMKCQVWWAGRQHLTIIWLIVAWGVSLVWRVHAVIGCQWWVLGGQCDYWRLLGRIWHWITQGLVYGLLTAPHTWKYCTPTGFTQVWAAPWTRRDPRWGVQSGVTAMPQFWGQTWQEAMHDNMRTPPVSVWTVPLVQQRYTPGKSPAEWNNRR